MKGTIETMDQVNEQVEKFNLDAEKYLKEKKLKTKKPVDFGLEHVFAFALDGFKGATYRQTYNKNRWNQLKAVKDLAESKGISIDDLLDKLAE